MTYNSIEELFKAFETYKVMVIGDVMIDAYLWGNVDRISPEAPVPIVACNKRENRLGGAANVALNLQSLGAAPYLCSVIGNDDKAKTFLDLLDENHLWRDGIITDESRITTTKTRIISNHQQLLRVDQEITTPISPETEDRFIGHLKTIINETELAAIIFQDYDKGAITPKVISEIVEIAKTKGIPTLVDPKKRNFDKYKGVTLFKPNFKELVEGMKVEFPKKDLDKLVRYGGQFRREHQIDTMLVTLSELGVIIIDDEGHNYLPAEIRSIADVSGAGDTVISMASLCLAAGLEPREIARLSNLAGGLVCEEVGVVPIGKERILAENIVLKG